MMMNIIIFLFFSSVISFFMKNFSCILMLLNLELISLIIMMFLFSFNVNVSVMLFLLLFIVLEAIFGLSMLIMMLRMFSTDKSMSLKF